MENRLRGLRLLHDMSAQIPSRLLVGAQLALLVTLAIPDHQLHLAPAGIVLVGLGAALGLWALLVMGRHLRIMPEPAAEAKLLRRGPYRLIRHPMYSALMLAGPGWLLCDFSWARLACFAVLLPVLALKAAREERLLGEKFPDYAAYRATTRRFIPWVW
ncbi:MAG: isoprenylcysteine carboxylmethyltransferase family protein [Kiritimatiellaeota bacterium]|nr:isoprenylcysteine carboxylmethyltransferase family protein [Kiritimatiellota bacterium]